MNTEEDKRINPGPGRPLQGPERQKMRSVMLSDAYVQMARELGDGNLSLGLRRALEKTR